MFRTSSAARRRPLRARPGRPARRALLAACLSALLPATSGGCAEALPFPAAAQAVVAAPTGSPAPDTTLRVDAILNGGFELVADATTDPPKYGAYWNGAFAPVEGDPHHLIVDDGAFRGERLLRLSAQTGTVSQKLVGDPRRTESVRFACALRLRRGGEAEITLEDGPGQRVVARLALDEDGRLAGVDEDGQALALRTWAPQPDPVLGDAGEWWQVELDLGALFVARHGRPPVPRLLLHLRAASPAPALVDFDEVRAVLDWPLADPAALAAGIEELVRWSLRTWWLPRDGGGLGLVDPETGWVNTTVYDVISGEPGPREPVVGFHTIHVLLTDWLREARRTGQSAEVEFWTPRLERSLTTLLQYNFDPGTGLPAMVRRADRTRLDDSAVALGPWAEFLLDAREQVADPELAAACLAQARRIADTLVELQRRHDIPPERAPPRPVWNAAAGRLHGDTSNWFGNIPDRLTPKGAIETDKRFYTSWAILTGRRSWYEYLSGPRVIARVTELDPRPGDLDALHRAVGLYHRDWDAARYDLENDTDDHYGYLCDDGLAILQHIGEEMPDALALVQAATDHRLQRQLPDGRETQAGDTLWVQAVRLGTACAGDSPRAFLGLMALYELPDTVNPISSRLPLYREALLELARNDLQGRQLTNSEFTDSFFKAWEMVCICYRGTYQGDCREQPADYWHGDVGDTFGGPPTNGIDAQHVAWRVAREDQRQLPLAALTLIRDVSEASLRRPHGYLFGLDPDIARQYELPEKYTIGLSSQSAAGLGYVMAWMRLLPALPRQAQSAFVAAEVDTQEGVPILRLRGSAGGRVAVLVSAEAGLARLGPTDARALGLHLSLEAGEALAAAPRVALGAAGTAHLPLADLGLPQGWAQPLLLAAEGNEVLRIGPAVPFGEP